MLRVPCSTLGSRTQVRNRGSCCPVHPGMDVGGSLPPTMPTAGGQEGVCPPWRDGGCLLAAGGLLPHQAAERCPCGRARGSPMSDTFPQACPPDRAGHPGGCRGALWGREAAGALPDAAQCHRGEGWGGGPGEGGVAPPDTPLCPQVARLRSFPGSPHQLADPELFMLLLTEVPRWELGGSRVPGGSHTPTCSPHIRPQLHPAPGAAGAERGLLPPAHHPVRLHPDPDGCCCR